MTVKSPGRKRWPTSVRQTQVADAVSATRTSKPDRQASESGATGASRRDASVSGPGRRDAPSPWAWCGGPPQKAGTSRTMRREPTVGAMVIFLSSWP